MKFKSTALVIIIATATLIGLLNFVINRASSDTGTKSASHEPIPKEDLPPIKAPKEAHDSLHSEKIDKPRAPRPEEEKLPPKSGENTAAVADLSADDLKKINAVASLADAELTKEMDALKDRLEQDDIFGQLEDGELSPEKEAEAKDLLERFALLGLEETRRKYMAVEPELKDPIYAHRESLKEIRELLSDEE